MNKARIDCKSNSTFPIVFLIIGYAVLQISTPLKITQLMSIGTWIIVFSSVFAIICSILNNTLLKSNSSFLILTLLLMLVAISMLFGNEINYNGLVAALCFLEIPFFMISYNEIISDKLIKLIYTMFFLLSLYYIGLDFSSLSNVYYTKYGSREMEFATLGYDNPNETSMYLVACFIILVSMIFSIKKRLLKTAIIVDAFFLFRVILETQSRTGIIACIVLLVLAFLYKERTIPGIIKNISFFSCIAFLLITVFYYDKISSLKLLGDKLDTGRYGIYEDIINKMTFEKFLFGDFTLHFENLHNSVLTVFATVGFLATIAFFFLIYKRINIKKTTNNMATIGILCLIMTTATEGALLTKGSAFAASFLSVYFLCITKSNVKAEEDDESITNQYRLPIWEYR